MKQIYFCRDGVLRMRMDVPDRNDRTLYSKFIPLRSILDIGVEKNFLSLLNASVIFEDHLTIGELIENLAPWTNIIEDILDIDLSSFIEELRQPPTPLKLYAKSITIKYLLEIELTFSKLNRHRLNLPKFLGEPLARESAGIEFIDSWYPCVNLKDSGDSSEELVRLVFTPLSEWKHLPITIEQSGRLLDRTGRSLSKKIGGGLPPIFNRRHPLVEEYIQKPTHAAYYSAAVTPVPATLYSSIICGLLREIFTFGSPQIRDDIISEIKLSVEEARNRFSPHQTGAAIYDFKTGGPVTSDKNENRKLPLEDFLSPIHETIELLMLTSQDLNLAVLDDLNISQNGH